MKRTKFVVIFVVLMLLTACGNQKIKVSEQKDNKVVDILFNKELHFEINTEITIADLIRDNKEYKILNADEVIDSSLLGEKVVTIKYVGKDKEKEAKIKINIVDTTKPTIELKREVVTTVGNKIDLIKDIKVSDNSKEEITPAIEGEYDFDKVGTYYIRVLAIDSSNNAAEEVIILKVNAKKQVASNPTPAVTNSEVIDINPSLNIVGSASLSSSDNEVGNGNNADNVEKPIPEIIHTVETKYSLDYKFGFVQNTSEVKAYNKQDIINIIYTGFNQGDSDFSFYCGYSCIDDLKAIINDGVMLYIQDYIHPYNTLYDISIMVFKDVVTITGTKRYTDSQIATLNSKVDRIISANVNSSMTTREKILALHDYLVNNNSYEVVGDLSQHSAVGALINGKSVCEGYAHAMAIFLNKLNIPNYRISTRGNHVWNYVYVDGQWLHLDVTWDDPVTTYPDGTREEILTHDYFLVSKSVITREDTHGEHAYNALYYKEA